MERNLKIAFEITVDMPEDMTLTQIIERLDVKAEVNGFPDAVVCETIVDVEDNDDELPDDEDEDSL